MMSYPCRPRRMIANCQRQCSYLAFKIPAATNDNGRVARAEFRWTRRGTHARRWPPRNRKRIAQTSYADRLVKPKTLSDATTYQLIVIVCRLTTISEAGSAQTCDHLQGVRSDHWKN